MSEKVLEIISLTKRFGRITAVDNLNLSIEQGQVFGLLGPNGSGKTTTLGMILDIIAPTSGSYSWFGGKDKVESRKQIGSILEMPSFYPYLSAYQNLRIAAHIKGVSFDLIDPVLELVNLADRRDDKFKTYSLGMKQRLSIGSALLADPPLLILDEPTNGLDPQGIAEVRLIIERIAAEDKTILIASHLLDEVQKVCSDYCVLRKGVKLHEGKVADTLTETDRVVIDAEGSADLSALIDSFAGFKRKTSTADGLAVELAEGYSSSDLNKWCFEQGIALKKLVTQKNSLEQEFLKILKEND